MNTIIYLYHSREPKEFVWERWRESDYCLNRLGIPALLWQNRKEQQRGMCACLEELHELQTALCLLGDSPYWIYCAYEGYLKEKINQELWKQYWSLPEFEDYRERMWAEKLLPYTVHGHYMILGYADWLPFFFCENVKKMRSVKWFLKEKHYSKEVQEFLDEFFEEYGLAVEVHLLDEGEEWIRVRPQSTVPVNVLDFTGEEKISACDVAKGSVWLDMDALDGKSRRISARNPGISYFSLKKLWQQRQKEPICLDTISKNGYNT